MKMPNITPGPWKADQATINAPDAKVSIACVLDIAWPYGIKPSDPEANATAIAALPDLLEALLKLHIASENIGGEHVIGLDELKKASEFACAALLKAGCTNA